MFRRAALVAATLALALPVGLTTATPASAAYPKEVRTAYMKACVKSAKKAGATSRQAKTYCRATLRCLERRLSLSEFVELSKGIRSGDKTPPHNRALKACKKKGQDALG